MSSVKQYPEKYFRFENDIGTVPSAGPRHYHNALELYYLEEGECRYFIENKSYDVKAGDLVLIPEGVIHHTSYIGGLHVRKLIYCSRAYIPPTVTDKLGALFYLYRNEEISQDIRDIFNCIEQEYEHPDGFSKGVISANISLLFFLLARNKNQCSSEGRGNEYVIAAIEYIQSHFYRQVCLREVAAHVSVSPEHLSRIFKKETCFGFSEYLTLVRMKKAEELLKSGTEKSIAEIAYSCGFNDSNYFSEKFKQNYGCSPLKYRKTEMVGLLNRL